MQRAHAEDDAGPIDLAPWIARVESIVAAHRRGPGLYARIPRRPRLARRPLITFSTRSTPRQPHRAPDALVETCLGVIAADPYPLGRVVSFAEIDWVYCLSRALAQSDRLWPEGRDALRAFATRYTQFLLALDIDTDDGAADLHRLFGAVCALAELQRLLPGRLRSRRPLRLVLDRRPFI